MLNRIRKFLSVTIIMALLLGGSLSFGGRLATASGEEPLGFPEIELPGKGNPKLDSQLNQLVTAETQNQDAIFAQQSNIELADDTVRVIIECVPGQIDAARKAAAAVGVLETSYRNLLQARVPVASLMTMVDTSAIRFVRMPQYPVPQAR